MENSKLVQNLSDLVSVIIPIHNRYNLVDQAVQSVYYQTHRPIELIIVDDYSDEVYKPKIFSKQDFQITVLRHNENKGPGASRETGRQVSTGDFVAYLDSDDLWHSEKLEKQVAILQSHPETGMCYCQSIEFTQWPLTGRESYRPRSDRRYSEFLPVILEQRPWGTGACLWTKDATDLIGPWSDSWHLEDGEYDSRAGCKDIKISYIPEVLCYFRINTNGTSLSGSLNKSTSEDLANSILKISENLKQHDKLSENKIRFPLVKRLFNTAFLVLNLRNRVSAFKLFKEICDVSSKLMVKIIFFFVAFFSLVFPLKIMKKLKYRLKKYIFLKNDNIFKKL